MFPAWSWRASSTPSAPVRWLNADRRTKAKTTSKSGYGDRGTGRHRDPRPYRTMVTKRDEIATFLKKEPTRGYCDDCLKQALGLSATDVTMNTANFADLQDERVAVAFGWCSECRKR
jgi:hypothetical protein